MGQMTQVLGRSIDCQRVVRVYGGAPYELRRFMAAANQLRQNGVKRAATSSSNTGITQLIVSVALAVIICTLPACAPVTAVHRWRFRIVF